MSLDDKLLYRNSRSEQFHRDNSTCVVSQAFSCSKLKRFIGQNIFLEEVCFYIFVFVRLHQEYGLEWDRNLTVVIGTATLEIVYKAIQLAMSVLIKIRLFFWVRFIDNIQYTMTFSGNKFQSFFTLQSVIDKKKIHEYNNYSDQWHVLLLLLLIRSSYVDTKYFVL